MADPLRTQNGQPVASASGVTFKSGSNPSAGKSAAPRRGLNAVPSFSVLSSGLPLDVTAEELIMKGAKKKPVGAGTIQTFYNSITHLHFANQKLLGDVAAVALCTNLRVLYVYDNRLTTLRGLGGLQRLTHLYAQDNRIESLHDFEAPPNLQQLHLTGNLLQGIGGLETCIALQELHVGSQKTPASAASPDSDMPAGTADLLILEEPAEGATDEELKAKAMAAVAAAEEEAAAGAPMQIEPASLMAIAPTLQKLVIAHSRIDDDALEPLIVLQSLTSLDVRHNNLEHIGRLQQFLLRMPDLQSLQIAHNPLAEAPKLRERLIVAAPRLAEVDSKAVKPNERAFLQSLAARQGAAAAASGIPGAAADAMRETSGARNRGRPQQLGVSIPSAQSFDLGPRAGLILGEPPAGFYEETHQPVSLGLNSGNRRPWARNPAAA